MTQYVIWGRVTEHPPRGLEQGVWATPAPWGSGSPPRGADGGALPGSWA